MIFKIIGGKAVRYDSAGGITKIDDLTVDFSQAESRENIAPTDTMKIILGKIMKWFSDLSAGAASSLLGQNLTAGKVLVSDDGGKVAASAVDANKIEFLSGVTGDIQSQINSLNSAMKNYALWSKSVPQAGMSITELPEGIYNLSSSDVSKLINLPKGFVGGRTTILTSGTPASDERIILLMNSKNGALYFGYQYGGGLVWKNTNLTTV